MPDPVGRTAGWAGIPTAFFVVFGTSITALVNWEKVAEKTLFCPASAIETTWIVGHVYQPLVRL
jgi:hypothetical protein